MSALNKLLNQLPNNPLGRKLRELLTEIVSDFGGGEGGVSDHGNLDGLNHDDHPQYLTTGRANLLYSLLNHNHTGVYAQLNHNHTGVYSSADHNHDGIYAPLNHTHNDLYSLLNHTHSGLYSPVNHTHSIYDLSDVDLSGAEEGLFLGIDVGGDVTAQVLPTSYIDRRRFKRAIGTSYSTTTSDLGYSIYYDPSASVSGTINLNVNTSTYADYFIIQIVVQALPNTNNYVRVNFSSVYSAVGIDEEITDNMAGTKSFDITEAGKAYTLLFLRGSLSNITNPTIFVLSKSNVVTNTSSGGVTAKVDIADLKASIIGNFADGELLSVKELGLYMVDSDSSATEALPNIVAPNSGTGRYIRITGYGVAEGDVGTGVYALIDHNHDADYAGIVHNHDDAYSSIGHDHEGLYSPVAHDHDSTYAPLSHTHNSLYYLKSEVDGLLVTKKDKQKTWPTLTDAATVTMDATAATRGIITLNGNRTLVINNAYPDLVVKIKCVQGATGGSFDTLPGDSLGTLSFSVVENSVDLIIGTYDGATWYWDLIPYGVQVPVDPGPESDLAAIDALTNLALNLDFSYATGRWQLSNGTTPSVSNNDPIGRIEDRAGLVTADHYQQATSGDRPLLKTAQQNSLDVAEFASSRFLKKATAIVAGTETQGVLWLAVQSTANTAAYPTIFMDGSSSSWDGGMGVASPSPSAPVTQWSGWAGGETIFNVPYADLADFVIVTVVRTTTRVDFYVNNVQVQGYAVAESALGQTADNSFIGVYSDAKAGPFTGYVGQIVYSLGGETGPAIEDVTTALMTKWGITP